VLFIIILTYNEQSDILDCIDSARFADKVLVFDSYSTDDTVSLARSVLAEVIQHKFENYAAQRNAALEAARAQQCDWVFFLDADERISLDLAHEIRESITYPGFAGFQVPRHNFIFGKLTQGAGWYPDYQMRLLRAGAAQFASDQPVHEVVELQGRQGTLNHPLIHYNYRSFAQFIHKQRRYAKLDAQSAFGKAIRPRFRQYLSMPVRHFWWRFVTLRGYSDGLHGLRMSLLMAIYELYRLLLLRQLWQIEDYRTRSDHG